MNPEPRTTHPASRIDIEDMILPCAPRLFLALTFGAGVVAGIFLAAIVATIAWHG